MENKIYNTGDLKFAEFKYDYSFVYYDSCGENFVGVNGQRKGVLFESDGHLVDLISGIEVDPNNIISESPINSVNISITMDRIMYVFNLIEDATNYMAVETKGERSLQVGDLFSCVPSRVEFKSSEISRALVQEFENRAMIADANKGKVPRCELDKVALKVKSIFKRK